MLIRKHPFPKMKISQSPRPAAVSPGQSAGFGMPVLVGSASRRSARTPMLALLVAASQPLASLGSLQPHPTILGRSGVIAMTMRPPPPPPPPPPLSPALLAADGAVVAGYSISCSLVGLFTSGAYLEPPIVSFQDVIDIAYAFDVAAALSLGWMLASAAVGAASNDWITQDHSASPIGLSRVLPAWLLGWPLGCAPICVLDQFANYRGCTNSFDGWSRPFARRCDVQGIIAMVGKSMVRSPCTV